MARSLASKTNVTAPGGSYPYGRMKDVSSSGAGDGTPLNEDLFGDMTQFFERLMALGSITANGHPENNTSGFQYILALRAYLDSLIPQLGALGHTEITTTGAVVSEPISVGYDYWRPQTKFIELNMSGSFADDIVSLGDQDPLGTEYVVYYVGGSGTLQLVINSTNAGAQPVILKAGVAGSDSDYTMTANQAFRIIRFEVGWVIVD